MQPRPPSPAFTCRRISSTKCIGVEDSGEFGVPRTRRTGDQRPETGSVTPKITDCGILKTETVNRGTGKSAKGMGRGHQFSHSPFLRFFFPIEPGPVLGLVADRR